MTPTEVVDYLTYVNYRFNREHFPEISAKRWAAIYSDAAMLEAHYQAELTQTEVQ